MRRLYIVAPGTVISASVKSAAAAQNCNEIIKGIPLRLVREGVTGTFPFVHVEDDDPDITPLRLAAAVLRNQFQNDRTPAQINNCLDAITVILRRIAKNELDR